jgi:hypothetical protein
MKLAWWMIGGSILSSLGTTLLFANQAAPEVWLGMTGPLAAALAARIATDRAHKRHPTGVTSLLIKAFAGKMIFFAAYISLVLTATSVRAVPFVISFTIYFLAFHVTEAICLHRLFTPGSTTGAGAPRSYE